MVVHMALNIVSSLVIIRYLAPPNYGDYVLVLTLMTMIGLLSDFGLSKLGIREVAVDGDGEAEVVGTVIALRLGLAMVAAIVIQLVLFALGRSAEVHTAAAIASITFAANVLLSVTIAFNVRLQQHVEAFTILFGELVETSLILWVVLAGGTLTELFAATVFGTALAALIAIFLAHRRLSLRARFTRARVAPLLRGALPLAAASMIGIVLVKLDSFMLAILRSRREVGLYGAAYAPIEYLGLAALALITVLLPLLGRYAATDKSRFLAVYRLGTEALLAFVLPIAVIVAFLAPAAVTLVYSDRYAGAATPMRLLAVGLVMMTFCAWYATVLLAVGKEQLILRYNTIMLCVGLCADVLLISLLGATGAALGTILVGAVTACWAWTLVRRFTHVSINRTRVLRVAAANGVIALIASSLLFVGVGVWIAVGIGALAYLPALMLLRVAPRDLVSVLTAHADNSVSTAGASA